MQFNARLVAFSAAIAQVLAIPQLTNSVYNPVEGQPFTITWTGASGSVTLLLKDGASNDLKTVSTIASGLTGSSYTWTPSGLPSDEYAIEITDSTGTNYSPQFPYAGTGTVSATTSATTVSAPSSTSSASTTASSTKATTSTTSALSSSTAATTSASNSSSTASSTGASNSTTTAKTTLSTATSKSTSTSSSTSSTSTPSIVNTNDSKKLGSSLAFVVLTAAALLVCN